MIAHGDKVCDVVQIRHVERRGLGSGRLVARNLVLTARHVLAKVGEPPKDGWRVLLLRELLEGKLNPVPATIRFVEAAGPDIALLELEPEDKTYDPGFPPIWGQFTTGVRETAWGIGFPRASAESTDVTARNDYQVTGTVVYPSAMQPHYLLTTTIELNASTAQEATDLWGGLSGAAMFIGGTLIGVVEKVPEQFATDKTLRVTALRPVAAKAQFAQPICQTDALDLREAAQESTATGADPDRPLLAELRDVLHLFDRDLEASEVEVALRKGVSGDPALIEVIVHGLREDLPDLFVRRLSDDPLRRRFNGPKSITPIVWPANDPGVSIDRRFSNLLAEVMSSLNPNAFDEPTIEAVLKLAAEQSAVRWFHIELPIPLAQQDLDLLDRWVRFWRDAATANRVTLRGYVLTLGDYLTLPAPMLAILDAKAPSSSRQIRVALRHFSKADVREWPNRLETSPRLQVAIGDNRRRDQLVKAARALDARLLKLNWNNFYLEDLNVFLAGGVATP